MKLCIYMLSKYPKWVDTNSHFLSLFILLVGMKVGSLVIPFGGTIVLVAAVLSYIVGSFLEDADLQDPRPPPTQLSQLKDEDGEF
jgi:hypothetical protein